MRRRLLPRGKQKRKQQNKRIVCTAASVFVIFSLLVVSSSAGVRIEEGNSLIVVKIEDENLSDVLSHLSEKFGFSLDIVPPLTEKVSTVIRASSLEEVIIKILNLCYIKNYSIHFDSKGNIKGLKFYKTGVSTKPIEKTSMPKKILKLSEDSKEEETPPEREDESIYETPLKSLYLPPKSTY